MVKNDSLAFNSITISDTFTYIIKKFPGLFQGIFIFFLFPGPFRTFPDLDIMFFYFPGFPGEWEP